MTTDPSTNLRYAAHLALAAIGPEGQARIARGRIALIGLGGLGCAAAQYLVGSGLGQLTLCDFDRVDTSNLARQLLYSPADVGRLKTEAAAERLSTLNPHTLLNLHPGRVDRERALELASGHDLLIDASDNYGTRLAVNAAALASGKPWIMGSCIRLEGQLALFSPGPGQPCYRCAYGGAPDTLEDCPGAGIFAPVAGIVGAAMALLALKHLAGLKADHALSLLDAEHWTWRRVALPPRSDCPACGAGIDPHG